MTVMPMARRHATSPHSGDSATLSKAQELTLHFATLVTVADDDCDSFVHRFGQYSVFGVVSKCCQGAVRETMQASGLKVAQVNKLLEKFEFNKVRNRYTFPDGGADQEYIGSYSYGKRRWRDPSNPADRGILIQGYKALREAFEYDGRFTFVNEESLLSAVRAAREDALRRRKAQQDLIQGRSQGASNAWKRSRESDVDEMSKRTRSTSPVDAKLGTPQGSPTASAEVKFVAPQALHEVSDCHTDVAHTFSEEDRELEKRTAAILVDDPFEFAGNIFFDDDFFQHLLPATRE